MGSSWVLAEAYHLEQGDMLLVLDKIGFALLIMNITISSTVIGFKTPIFD